METDQINDTICCPPFESESWDNRSFEWENKFFIKESVFTFLYMPVNFGRIMRKLNTIVTDADAAIPDGLCLSDHTSKWNMDVYLAVDREIPAAEMITMSGNYFCRVYEGPFKNTKKWCADFEGYTKSQGINTGKQYMWYTTCPKCAKKYGKNYVAILAEVT